MPLHQRRLAHHVRVPDPRTALRVGVDEAPYPDGPGGGSLRCLNRQAVPRSQRPDATARLLCQPARWHQGLRQVPLSAFGFRLSAAVQILWPTDSHRRNLTFVVLRGDRPIHIWQRPLKDGGAPQWPNDSSPLVGQSHQSSPCEWLLGLAFQRPARTPDLQSSGPDHLNPWPHLATRAPCG